MSTLHVFIDVSANRTLNIGIGSKLIINESQLKHLSTFINKINDNDNNDKSLLELDMINNFDHHKSQVESSIYDEGRSTNLELLNMCETLKQISPNIPVILYTDCQVAVDIYNKMSSNKSLNYYIISKVLRERLNLNTIKVLKIKGHNKLINKNVNDLLFSLVDKRSRKLLRLCVDAASKSICIPTQINNSNQFIKSTQSCTDNKCIITINIDFNIGV